MCRHLGYLGDPLALHDLLFGAPHSLCDQARHPPHQTSGHTNPDGWGVAWYSPDSEWGTAPVRHRTVTPIWEDTTFAVRSREIASGAVLAAARLASPGAALVEAGNAPFVSGPWSFSLNGVVHRFREGVQEELRAHVSRDRLAEVRSDADTEVLFALVLDRLDAGDEPDAALAAVIDRVTALTTGRLNLLLSDGTRIAATRYGNSLFALPTTVASEPLDAARNWLEVLDESVVVITTDALVTTSL